MTSAKRINVFSILSAITLLCLSVYSFVNVFWNRGPGLVSTIIMMFRMDFFLALARSTLVVGLLVSSIGFFSKQKILKLVGFAIALLGRLPWLLYLILQPALQPRLYDVILFITFAVLILTVATNNKGIGIVGVILAIAYSVVWWRASGYINILYIPVTVFVLFSTGTVEETITSENAENKSGVSVNPVDKIIKLKSLLDSGAITQEEFESKKKEILK